MTEYTSRGKKILSLAQNVSQNVTNEQGTYKNTRNETVKAEKKVFHKEGAVLDKFSFEFESMLPVVNTLDFENIFDNKNSYFDSDDSMADPNYEQDDYANSSSDEN